MGMVNHLVLGISCRFVLIKGSHFVFGMEIHCVLYLRSYFVLNMGSHILLCMGCHFVFGIGSHFVFQDRMTPLELFYPRTEGLSWSPSVLGWKDSPRVVPSQD